jgi:Tol biopolymer transport system component
LLAPNFIVRNESENSCVLLLSTPLDNVSEPLKERTIGIAVFDRPIDWDPKIDTIVRSEARRLRRKLSVYYASAAGLGERVRIEVPTGTYVPLLHIKPLELPEPGNEISAGRENESPDSLAQLVQPLSGNLPFYKKPVWFAFATLIVVFAGVIGRAGLKDSVFAARTEHFTTTPLTADFGHEFNPALSPDEQELAYVWDGGSNQYRIYIKSFHGEDGRRLTQGEFPELDPAWSQTGKQIAFLRMQGPTMNVIVRDLKDGAERMIGAITTQKGDWTGDPGPLIGNLGPAWAPDGTHVIVADGAVSEGKGGGLYLLDIINGSRQRLTDPEGVVQDLLPKVSPDGKTLAFVRTVSHGDGDVYLLDIATRSLKRLTSESHSINGLAWSRQHNQLVLSSNREGTFQLWNVDISDGIMQKINTDSTTAIDPQVGSHGDAIAYVSSSQNWNIDTVRVGKDNQISTSVERLIGSSGRNHSARYSPDGKKIAFVSDRSGGWEIWLCDLHCSGPQQLTHFGGPWVGGLSWSPDSREIAFDARLGTKSAIYSMVVANGTPYVLEQNNYEERMPSWSKDGHSLYFNSDRDGTIAIWKRNFQSRQVERLSPAFAAQELNRDGDVLLGLPDGSLWRTKPGKSKPIQLPITADPILAWTVYGDKIFYCTSSGETELNLMEYSSGRTRTIADLKMRLPRHSASLDISPDGQIIMIAVVDNSASSIYLRRIHNR